ncbi:alpha/beta fold hydrolase [Maricaulis sp. MIT060901]|uniref:alpha/beta fold hydrolase n=1 Tax=Maricaulis sp. MIT060901 TaxID=3096993 RepID=UPI00399BE2C6
MPLSFADLDTYRQSARHFNGPHGRIAWWMRGQGRPLLLIHGFPTCSYDWSRIWPRLVGSGFNPIALDMLGFGLSDKPDMHRYDLMQQADLHTQLMHIAEVDECDVVAHDYGVSIAQELLAKQNRGRLGFRINSVSFLNGGLFPDQHRARFIQRLLNSPLGPVLSTMLTRKRFGASFAAVFGADTQPDEEELDAFWELLCEHNGHRIGHLLIRYIRDRKQHARRWADALQGAGDTRLQLINGSQDPVSGRHLADAFAERVQEAQIVRMDGAGHYPQWEAPDDVFEALRSFLTPAG